MSLKLPLWAMTCAFSHMMIARDGYALSLKLLGACVSPYSGARRRPTHRLAYAWLWCVGWPFCWRVGGCYGGGASRPKWPDMVWVVWRCAYAILVVSTCVR